MRFAFVHAFPVYHDGVSTGEWLTRVFQEQWMAEDLARRGHEVEYWAVGEQREDRPRPSAEGSLYTFRAFPPDRRSGRSRTHFSSALADRARAYGAHLHLVKGVDGGAGNHLLRTCLIPEGRPFAFMLGGGRYSPLVRHARFVLCETERQKTELANPGPRLWRRPFPADRLALLPKSLDLGLFRPLPDSEKRWDILVACRLIRRLKNLDVLGPLSRRFRVAAAGTGRDGPRLRERFREVEWLGYVPYREMPQIYNQARLFMHPGVREESPKTITEAMACGLPVVAFSPSIGPDVLPSQCGLLVRERDFLRPIETLLGDEERRRDLGREARRRAEARFAMDSFRGPLEEMLRRLKGDVPSWPD